MAVTKNRIVRLLIILATGKMILLLMAFIARNVTKDPSNEVSAKRKLASTNSRMNPPGLGESSSQFIHWVDISKFYSDSVIDIPPSGTNENYREHASSSLRSVASDPWTGHSSEAMKNRSLYTSHGSKQLFDDLWFERFKKDMKKPNVLFIIADDMRPDIGIYNVLSTSHGSPWLNQRMYTPNLDRLAARSMLFTRAYSQIPWCNPSRSSFLTSRRPDTTMVHNNSVYFRENNPDFVTLPQFFKTKGYNTASAGKVFHRLAHANDSDNIYSWSMGSYSPPSNQMYKEPRNLWKAVKDDELHTRKLIDQLTTAKTIEMLDEIALIPEEDRKPFFVAMGLKKPHLPFVFPERFLDHYPIENISQPANPTAPSNLPKIAWFTSFEFRGSPECLPFAKQWTQDEPLPNDLLATLRRGYYASISYIDELIGSVLNKLEANGFLNDTIVAFIGDHGFHLGEQSILGKNTAFEVAANSPMMISVPGVSDGGMVTDKLVEFVDIYPTLVELAGFKKLPYCPPRDSRNVNRCTEGSSMVPLFREALGERINWKHSVFYQYPHYTGKGRHFCMGYTIRNSRFRYTEWTPYQYHPSAPPVVNRTELCGTELYDHQKDPHESTNLADDVIFEKVKKILSIKLRSGWSKALPRSK